MNAVLRANVKGAKQPQESLSAAVVSQRNILEAYELFKAKLINEVNALLNANDIPSAEYLCEKIPSENINDSDYTCEIWIAVNEK